jgi:MarR-like DNA-binding transcriptional regulator SgrR of sgrS sRNA
MVVVWAPSLAASLMASNRELKKLLNEAERQGWRIERGRGGHYKAYSPVS